MKMTSLNHVLLPAASLLGAIVLWSGCSQRNDPDTSTTPPAESAAESAPAAKGAVCAAHEAPKDLCFICDAGLRESGRLWCNEHARYEDRCWLCHPELEDKDRLYCKEHSLYEDECFLCHPELLPPKKAVGDAPTGASAQPEARSAGAGLMCREHGVLERDCGICHPELLAQSETGQGLKVRLPSAASADRAGVAIGRPAVEDKDSGIDCLAELTFDLNHVAEITPLVDGIVQSVEVDWGSRVEAGDVLARVSSVAIGEAQSAYLQALAAHRLGEMDVERERTLRERRISSEKDLQEAEAAYQASAAAIRAARQRLLVFGFDDEQFEALAAENNTAGVLELRAPFSGEIVERQAVRGALAAMGTPLFTLVDTSRLWAMVNIPESQLSRVREGQQAHLTVASRPGEVFTGTLTWVGAKVDPHTRMARGRVEVANAEGKLKAQMFARARLFTHRSEQALLVPRGAVQDVTGMPVVFLQSAPDLFEARPVVLGSTHDGEVEILAGLHPDESLVVEGGYALKSQLLISRLGAGCVH